jgi:hypothetical protein
MSRIKILFLILIPLLITSCSIERKIARQFNEQAAQLAFLTFKTDYILKNNEKDLTIDESKGLDEWQKDSLRLEKTLIIKQLDNDTILLDFFFDAYRRELARYGLKVYYENELDAFFQRDTNSWIANLAQVEIDEFDYFFQDSEYIGYNTYTFEYMINGLTFNAWFELTKVNDASANLPEILFASNTLYDEFEGSFVQNFLTGEINYRISHDSISSDDFLEFVAFLGRLYAGYTYDHLLNKYLDEQVPAHHRSSRWYRYDPYRKILFNTENDFFTPIED